MRQTVKFDYYYGSEADQFNFIRIPKAMVTDPLFADLSLAAKFLYGILLDRMNLSMKNKWFDAFEVLGGENYYEHNGFQTHRYYDDRANGIKYPVVGSTDSHSSYTENRNALICKTIVFAPECERKTLIKSIKDFYSVAVDTIDINFRLVGETRLCKYACFLLKYFFPLHDEMCWEEGRLMKQYVTGTDEEKAEAKKLLCAINGRMKRQREKYFDF